MSEIDRWFSLAIPMRDRILKRNMPEVAWRDLRYRLARAKREELTQLQVEGIEYMVKKAGI